MTTPQHLSDRYELGEILGFGGMSEVHLARDVRLHRDVAVKVLRADLARDPSFYLRFRREAQNAAALNHPAIVAVYDTGEAETATGPLPYIVMEYVDGVTLRDIVHNDGPLEPRRAIEIIADACQALNFSHQHGIIHRDVKPANIMLSKSGAVKVMDFGIARALHDGGVSVTQTAAVIGTAQYLSPEQARGETVDARSDVYSLGCVLYEVLTGEPPFVGDSPVAVAYQHVREDPVPPSERNPDLTPELDAVVLKALAKNPDNRYQTAAEMRTDLIRVHSGQAPEAPKVFTDAERTSLLSIGPSHGRNHPTDRIPAHQPTYVPPRERNPAIGRWIAVVAVLAVLTVVATVLLNFVGGNPRDVQIPDLKGQAYDDAVVSLQNLGFKTTRQNNTDSKIPPGMVISTDPPANTAAARDDEITINVSVGPEQREVPDVSKLSPADAERKLRQAGFDSVKQVPGTSAPEDKGRVTQTLPPANSTSAITNVITMVVGTGPDTKQVPDVTGQTPDVAAQVIAANGFTKPPIPVEVDGLTSTKGQVMGTLPAANTPDVPVDTAIQIQVSRGNQFKMPDLRGKFWDDAYPLLQQLGWQNMGSNFVKLPNAQNSGVPTNGVVTQDPAPGTPIKPTDTITLSFAQ
ncbi:Stk1 family PASTA domain-containing Ser/Thr kinase [Mycolicibacterium sp. 050158]|jgi:eukaryotic-like serine/threonine-protein kinase|uniref:Stk1 family PASTA domain-containing Ser/Thr kinase n=1 Tax=Mycolicibacterium sp. 050158 TaxID=3090602 RepID=UPI00299F5282|nr:Stk1 family PASTA domain-containing Ser/Thr kinase [Mycolicibacterium sp. 050158]MDX1893151.1 Stk1 family PASTA domain-containing Ser/Thr kinase [Mycolicibacterium sp. 050158]